MSEFLRSGLTVLWFLALSTTVAKAEGGCPQGMYPIGGAGVVGCAPMDGGVGATTSRGGRPAGYWLKTWGAIAASKNGVGAPITGARSKSEAKKMAFDLCIAGGGRDCEVVFTYKNQCVAVARVGPGHGNLFSGRETIEKAQESVQRRCGALGGSVCEIILAECTEPIFIRY